MSRYRFRQQVDDCCVSLLFSMNFINAIQHGPDFSEESEMGLVSKQKFLREMLHAVGRSLASRLEFCRLASLPTDSPISNDRHIYLSSYPLLLCIVHSNIEKIHKHDSYVSFSSRVTVS